MYFENGATLNLNQHIILNTSYTTLPHSMGVQYTTMIAYHQYNVPSYWMKRLRMKL